MKNIQNHPFKENDLDLLIQQLSGSHQVGDPNCRTQHDGPHCWRWYLNEAGGKKLYEAGMEKKRSCLRMLSCNLRKQ